MLPLRVPTKSPLSELSSALVLALGMSALLSSMDVHACAACGCTLSKDWESQCISSKPGFTVDLSYDNLNQNKQRFGSGAAFAPNGDPTSGGTLAYLAPGVSVRVGGGASVYGFAQIPIYQNVNNLQLTPGYPLTMGVRQSF